MVTARCEMGGIWAQPDVPQALNEAPGTARCAPGPFLGCGHCQMCIPKQSKSPQEEYTQLYTRKGGTKTKPQETQNKKFPKTVTTKSPTPNRNKTDKTSRPNKPQTHTDKINPPTTRKKNQSKKNPKNQTNPITEICCNSSKI